MMNQLGGRGKVIQIRSKGSHCLLLSSYPTHCSTTAVVLNTIMFVVPLSSMASILKHRDSSSIFLPWAAASTVCSLCWVRALLCTHTHTQAGRQAASTHPPHQPPNPGAVRPDRSQRHTCGLPKRCRPRPRRPPARPPRHLPRQVSTCAPCFCFCLCLPPFLHPAD